jgi:MFS family permease
MSINKEINAAFIILLYLTLVINTGVSLIVPVMPVLMRDFGFSYIQLSISFASIILARIIFQNVGGKLIRKIGYARLLIACFGLHMLTMGMYPFFSAAVSFIAMRFLEGAFEGIASTLLNDLAIALSTKEDRGKKMGYFNAAFGLGFIIGPALGAITLKYFGIKGMFWAAGTMSFIGVLGLLTVYKTLEGLAKPAVKSGFLADFNKEYLRYFGLFSPNFLRRVLLFGLQIILPLYLLDKFSINSEKAGYIFSLSGIISTVLMPFAGNFFVGKESTERSYRAVVACLVLMTFMLIGLGFSHNFSLFLVLFAIETVAFSFMLPAATKVFGDAVEDSPYRAQIIGFFGSIRELVVLVIPFSLVFIYRSNASFAWAFLGGICLVSAIPYMKYAFVTPRAK